MTLRARPRTVEDDVGDLFRRVKKLEAVPGGSGGGGGGGCLEFEPDMHRYLPFSLSSWVGYGGDGFEAPINDIVVDSSCWTNGYVHSSDETQDDCTFWTVWLGPVGAYFRLDIVAMASPDSGRLGLKMEKLTETAPGTWERDGAALVDMFGSFTDLYQPSPNPNLQFDSPPWQVGGEACDTPFTSIDLDDVIDGGPGMYRMWLYVRDKNVSSSGYDARLQSVTLRRFNVDEP